MNTQRLWDIFCTVIDNHGDLGVCWRLSSQLQAAGQRVRLWVDDASALAWMAPHAQHTPGITVLPWSAASEASTLATLPRADVWIEAFGCELPEPFVAHGVAQTGDGVPPLWVNLEYLSAEDWVPRLHGLPSPVMHGPARGWTKRFVYPGFTPTPAACCVKPICCSANRCLTEPPGAPSTRLGWRPARGCSACSVTNPQACPTCCSNWPTPATTCWSHRVGRWRRCKRYWTRHR